MAELADVIAPEHLSLQVRDPEGLLGLIRRAGAVFLGPLTPEAAGDYVAGPSHVLPTGGTVRFGSPLGVYDFFARTSVLSYSADALAEQGGAIADFCPTRRPRGARPSRRGPDDPKWTLKPAVRHGANGGHRDCRAKSDTPSFKFLKSLTFAGLEPFLLSGHLPGPPFAGGNT